VSRSRSPVTPAVRALRAAGVEYEEFLFDYERYPGAHGAASYIGIDPHLTAKTIVFSTTDNTGVVVLMHGDLEVSTKKLARQIGVKGTQPATPEEGRRWTGYEFGGTSPLGMRTGLPVVAQHTLSWLDITYVNAGSRGFVIAVPPAVLFELTSAQLADVST
jgi:Cys-tRNA(Pro) deacylase